MQKKILYYIEWLFLFLLIIQIGLIIKFNLSDIRCTLDHDWANTFYHFMEVIKNRTLQLPEWRHTTSLELDGSFLLSLPLYFIVKDLFLAVGISNIIFTLLYIFVVTRLMTHLKIEKLFIYITLTLILSPYAYGMLDYFNMLFFGGACYSIKVLIPIILLLLMTQISQKKLVNTKGKIEFFITLFLYLYLWFATTFSTGIYVMLCGIAPIFVWMMLEMFINGNAKQILQKENIILWILTLITFLFGMFFHNEYYNGSSRLNMGLTKIDNFAINFRACIRATFDVFGATTKDNIPVLSVNGIILCVKILLVVSLLISLIFVYLKFNIGKKHHVIANYLAFLYVWNFIVILLVDMRLSTNTHTEYRYLLIGCIPLIILFGIQLSNLNATFNNFQKTWAYCVLFFFCCALIYGNNNNVIKKWDRTTYAVEFCEYMNTLDVESAIFLDDEDSSIICKGLDNNHKYGAFISSEQKMYYGICSYNSSADSSFYGNKHILAAIMDTNINERIPQEAAEHYTYIGRIRWFDIYISDVMLLP